MNIKQTSNVKYSKYLNHVKNQYLLQDRHYIKAIILRFFILTTISRNLLIGLDDNLKTTHNDTSRD